MTNTPFSMLSCAFRARLVKTWIMSSGLSAVTGAELIHKVALENGFIRREKPVPGSALAEWSKKQSTPLWAALAALMLLLEKGWFPLNNEEWAGFASLFIKMQKSKNLDELLDALPEKFDKLIAAGWISAAIEEDECYKIIKNKRMAM
ncbi:hypothetical protein [Photorhabdus luminescens]|uniref:hypothetical protein n=1 Tax=Photorhabdus luminescens TaxID=29488 RepID=UPI00223F37BC|nr:hypothetical protein [Photorhabdus luminescens]MCW7764562.1 hypothetical protein [Photorhabdus luminescens subsp. venezuelensis]